MPFQEGNQLAKDNGGGRKGYEFEREQLQRMYKLFDGYLTLLEKLMADVEDEKIIKKLNLLGADIRKIIDKLHASKTDMTSAGEKLPPLYLPGELLIKNDIPQSTISNSQ